MLILGHEVGYWVAEQLRSSYDEKDSQAIGWERDGNIVCGVIYEDYNVVSVMTHIVCHEPMVRKFLTAIFDYPFRQLGVIKLIAPVPQANMPSIRLVEKMGFTREATITDAHPDGDLYLYTMHRDICRFLGDKHG